MLEGRAGALADIRRIVLRDGNPLHYLERGVDDPILLVHGGGRDLRSWLGVIDWLAGRWRVIAPSRRYCWPNEGAPLLPNYSPINDAADLAELLDWLDTGPAIVVGSSMGAAAALHLAVRRPDLVRALSLAEPPVHRWAERTVEGQRELKAFMERAWWPAARAFESGEPVRAMRTLIDHFLGSGAFDRLLPGVRDRLLENSRDFEAQTRSSDAFPNPGRDAVARVGVPMQMLSGEQTLRLHSIVDGEIARVLPDARRVIIPGARHDVWADAVRRCEAALEGFLKTLAPADREWERSG